MTTQTGTARLINYFVRGKASEFLLFCFFVFAVRPRNAAIVYRRNTNAFPVFNFAQLSPGPAKRFNIVYFFFPKQNTFTLGRALRSLLTFLVAQVR